MRSLKFVSFLLGATFVLLVWTIVDQNKPACESFSEQNVSFIMIADNIEDEAIEGDENIFFIDSQSTNFHNLDSHQACSVESAGSVFPMTREFTNNSVRFQRSLIQMRTFF